MHERGVLVSNNKHLILHYFYYSSFAVQAFINRYRVGTRLWDLHPYLFNVLLTPNRESGGQLLPPKPRRPWAKERERRLLQRSHTLSQLISHRPVGGTVAMPLFDSRGGATGATSQKSSFLRTVVYPSARPTIRGQLNGDSYGIRTHIRWLRTRPPDH